MKMRGQAAGWAAWMVATLGLVAGCGANVVVDPGGSATGQGGGGTTTGTGGGMGGGATSTVPPAYTCPAGPPQSGFPCQGPLTCSYGDGYCPAVFACTSGTWAQAGDCPQPACPADVPLDGSSCSFEGQSCNYDQQCGGAQAACNGGVWSVQSYGVDCAEMCPVDVPTPGQACDVCCAPPSCSYPVPDCQPTQAFCGGDGTWKLAAGECPPPPMPFCGFHSSEGECQGDPTCRWLVPGCGEPKLPAAGCFEQQDCASDADCGPQHCMPAVFDPCWNKGCNACGAKAMVCLP